MIGKRQRNTALLVAGCFFMENLDGTIVTTAAPRIGANLHVAPTSVGLVITSYLMTLGVLIPLSGWMAGRFGNRRVLLAAIVTFTFASLLCALSPDLGLLVAARVLQGIGGAMMVPVGRLTVLAGTARTDLLRLMSYIVWPALVAPVIAPLVGGVITTYTSWRWIFLINIPLGVAAFSVAWRLLSPSPPSTPAAALDWQGVILTGSGLGSFTYTAHLLSEAHPGWASVVGFGAASVVLIAAAVRHLLVAPAPLVDLRTLRLPSLRLSLSGLSLFLITVGAVPFLLTLLFQDLFRWSPVKSGLVVLCVFIGNIAIKPATTGLLNRFGFRANLCAASLGVAVSLLITALVSATTPIVLLAAVTVLGGAARSLGLTAYTTVSFSDVPENELRHANTLAATTGQLFAGIGVAAATVALRAGGPLGQLVSGHVTSGHFTSGHPGPATAYHAAFCLLALIAVVGAVNAVRLPRDLGAPLRRPAARTAR